MDHRKLGRSGLSVSTLTLGTMSFGTLGNTDQRACVDIVHRAIDAGINCIDTADIYARGEAETIIGRALGDRRDRIVLTTKSYWPMSDDPNERGGSRRWILRSCEASLRRLQTDHLDLYFLHKPDLDVDLDESLAAMTDLVRQGKVHTVGISTFPADLLVEAQWAAERRCLERPRVEQPPYSIFARQYERDLLPACERHGMGVMVWGPLNSGWLTGKYRADRATPAGARATRWTAATAAAFDPERRPVRDKYRILDDLDELAKELGVPLAHLAIAFTLAHPAVSTSIIGPRTIEQLEGLLGAANIVLEPAVLDAIDRLVAPGTCVDQTADAGWQPPWLADPSRRRRHR